MISQEDSACTERVGKIQLEINKLSEIEKTVRALRQEKENELRALLFSRYTSVNSV